MTERMHFHGRMRPIRWFAALPAFAALSLCFLMDANDLNAAQQSASSTEKETGHSEEVVVIFLTEQHCLSFKCLIHTDAAIPGSKHRKSSFTDPWSLPLDAAFALRLDGDQDHQLSQQELEQAEQVLFRLDLDDDELIGPLEIAPALLRDLPDTGDVDSAERLEILIGDSAESEADIQQALTDRRLQTIDPWKRPDVRIIISDGRISSVEKQPHSVAQEDVIVSETSTGWLISMGGIVVDVASDLSASSATAAAISSETSVGADAVMHDNSVVLDSAGIDVRPGRRGLFELLDRNGDSMLSRTELRAAVGLAAYNRVSLRDKFLGGSIASTATFRFSDGKSTYNRGIRLHRSAQPVSFKSLPGNERWFFAMDTNNDSDVSKAEFVGTASQFKTFDTNDDGLISIIEMRSGIDAEAKESRSQQQGSLK